LHFYFSTTVHNGSVRWSSCLTAKESGHLTRKVFRDRFAHSILFSVTFNEVSAPAVSSKQSSMTAMNMTVQRRPRSLLICILFLFVCNSSGGADFGAKAWDILKAGVSDSNTAKRQQAISSLAILTGSPRAAQLAEHALQDPQASVRKAAVIALGGMSSKSSVPKIKDILPSANAETVVAIAAVLKQFNDPIGYSIYYEILTGQRKTNGGILSGLEDKKTLEKMGFEEAIGFIPFGGVGWGAYEYFKRLGTPGVDVAAAAALATDPDPSARTALIHASFGGKAIVRLAALQALARRGDRTVVDSIEPAMYSEIPLVSYTAAAAIAHLTELPAIRPPARSSR
jgi:HEAT repeat protein